MGTEPYTVRFLPLAYEDLAEIYDHIAVTLANPRAADGLLAKLEKAVGQLRDFPYLGSEPEDAYLASRGYRKLVVDNYIVFHLVSDERREVLVMRVIHGAREYRNLL